jgi:tetratricopeptide (TPR) repeat protein
MGRRRNNHRSSENRDSRQADQAAPQASDQCAVTERRPLAVNRFASLASGARKHGQTLTVCGFLLLAVGLVFGQAVHFEFVNFDDMDYVYENPRVSEGLSAEAVSWAFTHRHSGNWHPLTWLSLMLDCQVYGANAGGHHLTNVLLHAATAMLLFMALARMTGGFWRSALVAAFFAIHPLHVESVAWVSERKDMLSGLFFVLTLGSYVDYVRSPFSLRRYLLLIAAFALGLMAKPMLVTLPLVLLLLDYWPLRRFPLRWQLVKEKVPLLLLSACSCGVTLWAQRDALKLNASLGTSFRIANALVSYVAYLGQLCCPVGLAAYYPHPAAHLPAWKMITALAVLAGLFAAALANWRRRPYLLVGWLWYVGMLVPVIGLLQVGGASRADRYTYLPQIGLCLALTWGAADVCRSWSLRRWLSGITSALVLMLLMVGAWRQTSFWSNSENLWNHTLACTSRNRTAHLTLGIALAGQKRFDEALAQYQKALEIDPTCADTYNNMGLALAAQGRPNEAITQYRKAMEMDPGDTEAYRHLGEALDGRGRHSEAIALFRQAVESRPDDAEARNHLGAALGQAGSLDEATAQLEQALKLNSRYAEAHYNLGKVLVGRGRLDEALTHFEQAVAIKPDYANAQHNLATLLMAQGRLTEAGDHYREALQVAPNDADTHYGLGNVLMGLGQFDEATTHYRKALEIKPDSALVHNALGVVATARGRFDEALAHYQQARRIQPNDTFVHYHLAWLRATCPNASLRNGTEAIEYARRADQLSGGGQPNVLGALAAAYAEAERFPEALTAAHKALNLALKQNNSSLAAAIQAHISLYEAGRPCRQPLPDAVPPPQKP